MCYPTLPAMGPQNMAPRDAARGTMLLRRRRKEGSEYDELFQRLIRSLDAMQLMSTQDHARCTP
jgi:hypothetical protein